ncbi:hypothetical protein BYT27DRAFT_7191072 [Phlegmacium glaucopus]|nr:hypothetical protein BYT27DRAFT_7191072 [Phlegmacium glaucopus]
MVYHSPFDDDDITYSDSAKYGIQVPESSERETPGQWVSPSPTFSRRPPTGPCQYNCEDRRPHFITKYWLASDRPVDLPDGHKTLANLFGRNYSEAFLDLGRLCQPREPSESRPNTPSLTSDDSHSHDSPSISPSTNFTKDLSLSPKLVSGVAQPSFESDKCSEAASALPCHSMEIDPISESSEKDNTIASVLQCSSEASTPRSEAPPRLRRSFQNSELRRGMQKLDTSTTQPLLLQPLCLAQSDTEDDVIDSAQKMGDDAYLPEPLPEPLPARSPGIRSRAKKSSGSFECQQCSQPFTRHFDMIRHMKSIHSPQTQEAINALTCTCCGVYLSRKDAFKRHVERIPRSCIRGAKVKKKPLPPKLSEETYAIRKFAMMEVYTHQSSRTLMINL